MGVSLDASVAYGISFERYPEDWNLPESFVEGITAEEIAKVTYTEIEDIDFEETISGVVELKFPLLGVVYPGDGEGEEMIVYIQRTECTAYYSSEKLVLEDATDEERAQLQEVAQVLGKTPGWLLFPTYG